MNLLVLVPLCWHLTRHLGLRRRYVNLCASVLFLHRLFVCLSVCLSFLCFLNVMVVNYEAKFACVRLNFAFLTQNGQNLSLWILLVVVV